MIGLLDMIPVELQPRPTHEELGAAGRPSTHRSSWRTGRRTARPAPHSPRPQRLRSQWSARAARRTTAGPERHALLSGRSVLLAGSTLRRPHKCHVEYLENMGVRGTIGLAVVVQVPPPPRGLAGCGSRAFSQPFNPPTSPPSPQPTPSAVASIAARADGSLQTPTYLPNLLSLFRA